MFLTTSASAISRIINNTVSVIHITPKHLGAETTAAIPLQHILYHCYISGSIYILYNISGTSLVILLIGISGTICYNITIVKERNTFTKRFGGYQIQPPGRTSEKGPLRVTDKNRGFTGCKLKACGSFKGSPVKSLINHERSKAQ